MPTDYCTSNGRQNIDDGHSYNIFNDSKSTAAINLDSCDMKPASF